jgi:hypothetical protein
MLKEDIEILDDMIGTLVDLLVEKEIITHEEYESKVKQRLKNLQIPLCEEIVYENKKNK